jgi:hypothetical protein
LRKGGLVAAAKASVNVARFIVASLLIAIYP